jgi:hypothetical protein
MDKALDVFAKHGMYGLIILGLILAIYLMWRHLQKVQDKYDTLQQMRVDEAKSVVTELMKHAESMRGLAAAVTGLKDVVQAQKAAVDNVKDLILAQRS